MLNEITIVTAFFDIGRGNWEGIKNGFYMPPFLKRTNADYINNFRRLALLNNDMIIHTTSNFSDIISKIREEAGYGHRTKIIVHDDLIEEYTPLLKLISNVMNSSDFISKVKNPHMPEYWNPSYILINYLKTFFVERYLDDVITPFTAWIDFGYCRDDQRFIPHTTWAHDFGDKINLFAIRPLDNRPLEDIVHTGDVYIQGCHIVGPSDKFLWNNFQRCMFLSMERLLDENMIDDDQTLLLMSYRGEPEHFKINIVDESRDGWFIIFKDYA